MGKILLGGLTALFIFSQLALSVQAMTSIEAKQKWLSARQERATTKSSYNQAQLTFAGDKSKENEEKLVDSAKKLLNSVLTEAESWLNWKKEEANENSEIASELKTNITNDVASNLIKIATLRTEVDKINTRLEVGLTTLKMVGSYVELLADVARNTGFAWVDRGDKLITKVEGYESKLRQVAIQLENSDDILKQLDRAKTEIKIAKQNVANAKNSYTNVKIPGMPLIKFAEGNNYLRTAKNNLTWAQQALGQAFVLIMSNNK